MPEVCEEEWVRRGGEEEMEGGEKGRKGSIEKERSGGES